RRARERPPATSWEAASTLLPARKATRTRTRKRRGRRVPRPAKARRVVRVRSLALAKRDPAGGGGGDDGGVAAKAAALARARRALRERTVAGLERRIADLPGPAFEALARVLLQREGFGPATFVKRVEGTIYVEALRGRGARPSRVLIALRSGGSTAGRRAVG